MKTPHNKLAYIESSKNHILSSLESGNLSCRGPFTLKTEEWLLTGEQNNG